MYGFTTPAAAPLLSGQSFSGGFPASVPNIAPSRLGAGALITAAGKVGIDNTSMTLGAVEVPAGTMLRGRGIRATGSFESVGTGPNTIQVVLLVRDGSTISLSNTFSVPTGNVGFFQLEILLGFAEDSVITTSIGASNGSTPAAPVILAQVFTAASTANAILQHQTFSVSMLQGAVPASHMIGHRITWETIG